MQYFVFWEMINPALDFGSSKLPHIIHYPLVNVYITMEYHYFEWVNQRTKRAIFQLANC